jgi:two-component system chemotaxis sensor kinase CheA
MDEIVKDFLIESNENLDRLDQELVKLESEPSSKELQASIFRTIHTIKGSCGFLGFYKLEKVAHAGESLLSLLRDGKLTLTQAVTSGLLAMVDAVRCMLGEIQANEHDGQNDYPELREGLRQLQGGAGAKAIEARAASAAAGSDKPSEVAASGAAPASAPAKSTAESVLPSEAGKIRILDAGPPAQSSPNEEPVAPPSRFWKLADESP